MKVLLIAIGTRGDVQPFVVLGKELAAKGYEVSIAASSGFDEMIRQAGLQHHVLPMDFQELLGQPEMQSALTSFRGKLKAYRWASEMMNRQLDTLWHIGLEAQPDLILQHFKGAVGPYIARKLGAICVPVMLQPGFKETGEYPQFLISAKDLGRLGNLLSHKVINKVMRMGTGMMIRRWRKSSGIDLGPGLDTMLGYNPNGPAYRIHAYSPSIVPRPLSWPEEEVQTGYLFDTPIDFEPETELADFLASGPAPVYMGFGSMPGVNQEQVKTAVLGALEKTGLRAIIASGWGGLDGFRTSENLHVVKAVPHSWLFPKVSAVVHHGGSGTTHEGLRWGRASVICPLFADQPFFGQRVAYLGVGAAPIPQKKLTTNALADALKVAHSQSVQDAASKLGERLRAEDGVARVCAIVDRLGM